MSSIVFTNRELNNRPNISDWIIVKVNWIKNILLMLKKDKHYLRSSYTLRKHQFKFYVLNLSKICPVSSTYLASNYQIMT